MQDIVGLALLFLFSLLGLIAALRLKLPTVMGILLAGALVGPNALGLIKNSEIVEIFSELGAILLLFVIGIEFSINKIMKFGIRAILVAFVKITFVFIICYQAGMFLGFQPIEAIVIGSIFAITSTTLFSKIVKGGLEANKDEINLMFAVLILEDMFAVFFLTMISALPGGVDISLTEIVFSIVKALVVLGVTYAILHKVVRIFFDSILKYKTDETLVFASLSVCVLFAFISSLLGFEASIGAFLAGSLMTSLAEFKRIEKTILPFGLFFSSFFFLSIGMSVDFGSLGQNFFIIAAFIGVSMLAKFASVGVSTYLLGYSSRSAIFSGITMLTVGEFSLLIAQKSADLVSFDLLGVVSVSVFLSALLSVFVIRKENEIDSYLIRNIPERFRSTGRRFSRYVNSVVIEFEPSGKFYRASMSEIKELALYTLILLVLNGGLYIIEEFLQANGIANLQDGLLFWGKIAVHTIVSLGLLLKIGKSLDVIITEFIDAFRKNSKKQISLERRVVYDAFTSLLLMGIAASIPVLMTFAALPPFILHLSTILILIAGMFIWDAIKTMHLKIKNLALRRRTYNPKVKSFSRVEKIRNLGMFLNI